MWLSGSGFLHRGYRFPLAAPRWPSIALALRAPVSAAEAAMADACRCASHAGYAGGGVAKLSVCLRAQKEVEVAQEQATTFEETFCVDTVPSP